MKTAVLGQPLPRVEGELKVTGRAQYAAEIPVPGVRFALLRCSPIAHSRIKSVDVSVAEKMPGVVGVLTYLNMPRLGTDIETFPKGTAGTKLLPLQDDHILYEGQYVACAVGETIEVAAAALAAIRIEYEEETPVVFEQLIAAGIEPEKAARIQNKRECGLCRSVTRHIQTAPCRSFCRRKRFLNFLLTP